MIRDESDKTVREQDRERDEEVLGCGVLIQSDGAEYGRNDLMMVETICLRQGKPDCLERPGFGE